MTKSIAFLFTLFAFGALSIATAQEEWTVTSNGSRNPDSGKSETFEYPVVDLSSFDLVPGTPMYWLGENLREVTYTNGTNIVDVFPQFRGLPSYDRGGERFLGEYMLDMSTGGMIRTDGIGPVFEGMGTMYNARAVYKNYFEVTEGSRWSQPIDIDEGLGLCPAGTRLPTAMEIQSLLRSFGGGSMATRALTQGEFRRGLFRRIWFSGANNQSGLTFLPLVHSEIDLFDYMGIEDVPCYWTSTLDLDTAAVEALVFGEPLNEYRLAPTYFSSYDWSDYDDSWWDEEGVYFSTWVNQLQVPIEQFTQRVDSIQIVDEYGMPMESWISYTQEDSIPIYNDYGEPTGSWEYSVRRDSVQAFDDYGEPVRLWAYRQHLPTINAGLDNFCFVRCVVEDFVAE